MLGNLTTWLKNYLAETLLSLCVVLVFVLSFMAGTWGAYVVAAIIVGALVYFLFQLRKVAKVRLARLSELDKGNREQLLNSNKAFNPDSVVQEITNNLSYATEFVREIGKGNFDARLKGINDENFDLNKENLAGELVNMKVKMKATAEEEKKRVWATQGLANFGDLLRTSSHDLSKLSEEVVIFVVKYLKANQGGIFILNDDDTSNPYLELKAAYAFERKKYLTKKVEIGEGLVGQTYLERETIHLRKLPNHYVSITSGLGGANPHTLILVPLKVEQDVLGVMEIASFKSFEPHEIEFCEKIGETIASTISSAKVNERTRYLLEQSQQQSEEMKAQEEEMRQNMEELQATQEEMGRKENDYIRRIEELEERLVNTDTRSHTVVDDTLQQNLQKLKQELEAEREDKQQVLNQSRQLSAELDQLREKISQQPTPDKTWANLLTVEKDLSVSLEAARIAQKTISNK